MSQAAETQPRLIDLDTGSFAWPAFAPDRPILALPRACSVRLFDLGDAYDPDGNAQPLGRRSRVFRLLAECLAVVIQIAADREILD